MVCILVILKIRPVFSKLEVFITFTKYVNVDIVYKYVIRVIHSITNIVV